jgi:hypothetical protein
LEVLGANIIKIDVEPLGRCFTKMTQNRAIVIVKSVIKPELI